MKELTLFVTSEGIAIRCSDAMIERICAALLQAGVRGTAIAVETARFFNGTSRTAEEFLQHLLRKPKGAPSP